MDAPIENVGRREHKKKQRHDIFGMSNLRIEEYDPLQEIDRASWQEVVVACCIRSGEEWGLTALRLALLVLSLYGLVFGLSLLGTSAQVLAGCGAATLFGTDANPLRYVYVVEIQNGKSGLHYGFQCPHDWNPGYGAVAE